MFNFFRNHGVLGLNARNLLYIKPFNPRKAIALADDKMKTKAFLAARGIPTAKVFARIETRQQLRQFDFGQLPDQCVLKPNHGFGGEGIIILKGRKSGVFLRQGKYPMTNEELIRHIEDILDGKFSLGGRRDEAFFEQILIPHPCFAPFRPAGLPDIRVVVFNLVPVMAMLRIPTMKSGGKANLHLGGLGIGIDIAKGVTTYAAQYNRGIEVLPHGGSPSGIQIPFWDTLLLACARMQYITNIGYLACDLTIDERMGPMLLEVNARAGLSVQIANRAPLRARLERVEGLQVSSPEKGVRMAQDLFGEKVRREDEAEGDRPVLGTREVITVVGDGTTVDVPCAIAPEEEHTTFAPYLIRSLLRRGAAEVVDAKTGLYRVKFSLRDRKIQTIVHMGDVPSASLRAVIGRRDLAGFLIDPTKEPEQTLIHSSVKEDLRAVDRLMEEIDRQLLILPFIKPLNLFEERRRLVEDVRYNPLFLYRELPSEILSYEERLEELSPDDSPLGILLEKKRRELLMRLRLLQSRGDAVRYTESSFALFGAPTPALITHALSTLQGRIACDLPVPDDLLLSAEQAVKIFQEALEKYGLHEWEVRVRQKVVADCTVGGKSIYLREDARFSREHILSLIAHEVETHVLCAENGMHQPFALFRRGFANYLDTQEGLASFNQDRVLSPYHEKRYRPAGMVLAIAHALKHSFANTRRYLQEELGFTPTRALTAAIAAKRGLRDTALSGALTKGLVYFRGLRAIEEYMRSGGDLRRLYIGKIALEDLALAEQVPNVQPPLLLPEFLREQPAPAHKKKKKPKKRQEEDDE